MDGSRWAERAERGRTAVLLLVLMALLAAVAIASTGSTPAGSGAAHRPSEWLIDVLVSLLLVVMALGSVLLVLLIFLRPAILAGETAAGRARPRSRWTGLLSLAIISILLALAMRRLIDTDGTRRGRSLLPGGGDAGLPPGARRGYEPEFEPVAVAVTLGVLAVGVLALVIAWRARRRALPPLPEELSDALADAIEVTLDDLRAERDARRAVIAAYARLEQVLAAHGAPRRAAEAPEEYLARVLSELDVPREAVSRLTALFSTAKFSQHEVKSTMKDEAIEALETARDGLRAAREKARSEHAHALALARERAAG